MCNELNVMDYLKLTAVLHIIWMTHNIHKSILTLKKFLTWIKCMKAPTQKIQNIHKSEVSACTSHINCEDNCEGRCQHISDIKLADIKGHGTF